MIFSAKVERMRQRWVESRDIWTGEKLAGEDLDEWLKIRAEESRAKSPGRYHKQAKGAQCRD